MWLAPAYVVLAFDVLVVAVAWLAWIAWPHHQVIEAIKSAPLAATISQTDPGLVKIAGNAFPPTQTSHVWRVTSRVDTSRHGSRRETYSVAPIVVRDAAGECRVDPQEAQVLAARSELDIQNQLFSGDIQKTERFILPGDPVFALGELDRSQGACRLRESGGVLLVSAKPEAEALFLYRLYFWPALAGLLLCLALGAYGFRAHLMNYENRSLAEFAHALVRRTFWTFPGTDR